VILAVLAAAVLSAQALVLGRALLGSMAPDPMVVLATALALAWPARRLLLAAVFLGWVRALVLVEPAGGQVLCAWAALFSVAAFRSSLRRGGRRGFLFAGVLLAAVWWLTALAVSWAAGVHVSAGRELLLGLLLAVPCAGLLMRISRPEGGAR